MTFPLPFLPRSSLLRDASSFLVCFNCCVRKILKKCMKLTSIWKKWVAFFSALGKHCNAVFQKKKSAIYNRVVVRNLCYNHANTVRVVACPEGVWFSPQEHPREEWSASGLLLSPMSLCAYPLTLRLEKKEKGMGAVVELRQMLVVWMGSGALCRSWHSSFPVRKGSVNLNRGFGIHMDQFCFLSRLRAPSKENKSCTLLLVLQKSSVGWKNLWNYILVPWWHCE